MINNQPNYSNLFKCAKQTATEINSLPAISDFYDSLELVGGSVFYLFANKAFSSVAKKMTRIEERSDALKRKIIFHAKSFDCTELLSFLGSLTQTEMKSIGIEFFFITSKKLSKNQSIATYAQFLRVIFNSFGFNETLIKNFFFNNRDADEVFALMNYLNEFCSEEECNRVTLISAERLSQQNKITDTFRLINKKKDSITLSEENNKIAYKIIINVIQAITMNGSDSEEIFAVCEDMIVMGFEFTSVICNKILDMFNRNLRNDGSVERMIEFMESHELEQNIITFNTLIDFYSMNGQFEKAYELFKSLEAKNIQADSYTYSILIKGIKNMKEPNLAITEELFEDFTSKNQFGDIIVFNSILDVLVSLGLVNKVNEFYVKMKSEMKLVPDLITFNTLIKGCCRIKDFDNAMRYFREMKSYGLKPSRITYNSLMDLAVKTEKLKNALLLLEQMQTDSILADSYTYSIILNGLKINESKLPLVKSILNKIKEIIENREIRLDEILFNSTLDVCLKYEIYQFMETFYELMRNLKVRGSFITYNILIKAYTKQNDFKKVNATLKSMVALNMRLSEVTYGSVLDACSQQGQMEECLEMYNILKNAKLNMNSIVFTTILKGYIKKEDYNGAMSFFNSIKEHKNLSGMIITYNCALDVLVRKGEIQKALDLFTEINENFKVDIISYSTIIKGLCLANRKNEAFSYIKELIDFQGDVDVSVMNLFLDSCSTPTDYKIGIKCYQYIMMKNIKPNEITFGIMVKIFGFSKELHKAFDLLDLMKVFEIEPSIIIFTNLIHISFYNRNPKKADLAYTLFKKQGLRGDRLLYSKLVDGMLRFKDHNKVVKYIDLCLKDNCCLKKPTLDKLFEYFDGEEMITEKLVKISKTKHVRITETKEERIKRFENNKQQKTKRHDNRGTKNNKNNKEFENNTADMKRPSRTGFTINKNFKPRNSGIVTNFKASNLKRGSENFGKKPLALFNFRNRN